MYRDPRRPQLRYHASEIAPILPKMKRIPHFTKSVQQKLFLFYLGFMKRWDKEAQVLRIRSE